MRRVLIIGYGKIARSVHAAVWRDLAKAGKAEVVAICDSSPARLSLVAADFGDSVVMQMEAGLRALENGEFDVADICTPGHLHAELVLSALAAGTHVLVEKPVCHDYLTWKEICAARAGRHVGVFQTLRTTQNVIELKRAILEGRLGKITRISVLHHARHVLNEAEWVTEYRSDGILFESAIHFIDLAIYLLGSGGLTIDAVKYYETSHRPLLTGFELLAHDNYSHHIHIDFLQDSLMHSGIQSRTILSADGADAELQFYPPSMTLLSGVVDPVNQLRSSLRRAWFLGRSLAQPRVKLAPHYAIAASLLEAIDGRTDAPLVSVADLGVTMATLDEISAGWKGRA